MKLIPHPVFRMGIKGLFAFVLLTAGVCAGTITYDPSSFFFSNPVSFSSGTNDVKLSTTASDENEVGVYSIAAEFCQTGACTGDSVSNPSQLRFTNMSLGCSSSSFGSCAGIDISFQATGTSSSASETLLITLDSFGFKSFEGDVTGAARICIADATHICTATAVGSQSTTILLNAESGYTGSSSATFTVSGEFNVVGDFRLDGLGDGNAVTLADSFKVTEAAAVPEPASLLLTPVGLGLFWLMRRNRARS